MINGDTRPCFGRLSKASVLKRIRVLLLEMPPMLLDIVTNIVASQDDIDVIAKAQDEPDLVKVSEKSNADVIILTRNEAIAGEYDELLYGRSRLKVIEIAGSGRHGALYELRPRRVPLGEMSSSRLLDAIRSSAQPQDK